EMIRGHDQADPIDALEPVVSLEDFVAMIIEARSVHVSDAVGRYVIDLVTATRRDERIALGASPRATLQLVRAAKAQAAVQGREYVIPDDVDVLAVPVLAHRLIVQRGAPDAAQLVDDIVRRTAVPPGT